MEQYDLRMDPAVVRAAKWAGIVITPDAGARLARYSRWLRTEAVVAGGLGPAECDRIDDRHVADSLCLAQPWAGRAPSHMVDVGSGSGLPGIPLAITHPGTEVTLLDRSGRRCRLMKRAVRVLELDNVEVVQADATTVERQWPVVVARASIPPHQTEVYHRLTLSGGMVVVAGSRSARPEVPGYTTIEIPAAVLDSAAWILTMVRP